MCIISNESGARLESLSVKKRAPYPKPKIDYGEISMTQLKARWNGKSGKSYDYSVLNIDTGWKDLPGNYIFAKKGTSGWMAIYIGQTDSLKDRLPSHEKRICAVRNGATHIHAHVNQNGERARKNEEADLIKHHQPTCNDLLK